MYADVEITAVELLLLPSPLPLLSIPPAAVPLAAIHYSVHLRHPYEPDCGMVWLVVGWLIDLVARPRHHSA